MPYRRNFRLRRSAELEAARLNARRGPGDPPVCVWRYIGGHCGRGWYVGVKLPERITTAKALVTLISDGRGTEGGG